MLTRRAEKALLGVAVLVYTAATAEEWRTGSTDWLQALKATSFVSLAVLGYLIDRHTPAPHRRVNHRERRMVFGGLTTVMLVASTVIAIRGATTLAELTIVLALGPAALALRSHRELSRGEPSSSS